MSKEETQITAEEFLKENYKIYPFDSKELALDIHANRCEIYTINLCNIMEQYAQAKVEELQKEISQLQKEIKSLTNKK